VKAFREQDQREGAQERPTSSWFPSGIAAGVSPSFFAFTPFSFGFALMPSLEMASLGFDSAELGLDAWPAPVGFAVVLRTGGMALGPGFVRDIEPLAVSVVPDGLGDVARPAVDAGPVDVGGDRDARLEVFEMLAGRLVGRAGGEVVVM